MTVPAIINRTYPMTSIANVPSKHSITIWSSPREREPARPLYWWIGSSICCSVIPTPLRITEIVALTFTNKAANEMKQRLRDRLQSYLEVNLRTLSRQSMSAQRKRQREVECPDPALPTFERRARRPGA